MTWLWNFSGGMRWGRFRRRGWRSWGTRWEHSGSRPTESLRSLGPRTQEQGTESGMSSKVWLLDQLFYYNYLARILVRFCGIKSNKIFALSVLLKQRSVGRSTIAVALVHGVVVLDVDQLVKRLLDEYEGDETGKVLLCEASDVADERAGIGCYEDHEDDADPDSGTESKREVRPAERPKRKIEVQHEIDCFQRGFSVKFS